MDGMDYPQEEEREIPKDLIIHLVKKCAGFYIRNLPHIIALSLHYFIPTLLSLYLLYYLQKTPFGYSHWFILLVFLYPLLPLFLFRHFFFSLLTFIGEVEGKREFVEGLIKNLSIGSRAFYTIGFVATFSLLSFSGLILPEAFYSFIIWLILLTFIPGLEKLLGDLRRGEREISPFYKREGFLKELLKGVYLIIALYMFLGLLIFPTFLPWYFDRGDLGVIYSSLILFVIQLFLISFACLLTAIVHLTYMEIKPFITYKPLSNRDKFNIKFRFLFLILLCISFLTLESVRLLNCRDSPPVNDSDLRLSKIEIPKSENAFYEFMRAHDESRLPADTKVLSDLLKNRDYKAISVILKQNEKVFPIIEKALNLPVFQSPQLQDPSKVSFDTRFPEYTKLRKLAHLCVLKADYLFEKGKEREAFDWILKAMKIGQMIEESPRPLYITNIVGKACKEIGLKEIRKLVPRTRLAPEELRFYAEAVLSLEPSDEAFIRAVKMDYRLADNSLRKLEEAFQSRYIYEELEKEGVLDKNIRLLVKHLGKPYYLPNETRLIYVERLRKLISYAKKLYKDADVSSLELPPRKGFILVRRNPVGEAFLYILMPIYPSAFYRHLAFKFSHRATAILLALKAYKREKRYLPERLSELVPKYLSKIPIDPFDGQPLRYSREGQVIYSVGRILRDLGPPPKGFKKTVLEKINYADMLNPAFFIDF